jgi:hypothetical protein
LFSLLFEIAISSRIASPSSNPVTLSILAKARQRGLTLQRESAEGWHRLVYHDPEGDVEVKVIPAGKRSPRDPPHAPPIPTPQELGVEQGLGYASFADWVAMELVANRD